MKTTTFEEDDFCQSDEVLDTFEEDNFCQSDEDLDVQSESNNRANELIDSLRAELEETKEELERTKSALARADRQINYLNFT